MRNQIYFISESRILYFIFLIQKFIKLKYDDGVKYVTHVQLYLQVLASLGPITCTHGFYNFDEKLDGEYVLITDFQKIDRGQSADLNWMNLAANPKTQKP